jgi:hypothetical protein
MKRFYPVLLLSIFQLGMQVIGQSVDENYAEKIWNDQCCSHKSTHFTSSGNKSIINPNPHVFDYDVKFYKLDLEATNTNNQFNGSANVSAVVVIPQMEIFSIEFSNKLVADSAFINGVKYAHIHASNNISVSLPIAIPQGTLFHFKLYYHTPANYTSSYYSSTLHPTYGNFPVSQTLSEPYFAHEFMPCKQELEDKADSVHVFITTTSDLKVAGPGLLTEVNLPDGKIRHEWRTYQKTAYYLIFFAVSDYQEYNIYAKPSGLPGDSILVQNYVFDYPNCLESNKAAIDNTVNMVNLLSNLYSLYPFHDEKYGHYLWYPTSFSGMEHITMSGMRYLNTYLISHELGHSWFGDNVTCASWSDIWINEGFATYTEYLVNQYLVSQAAADANMLSYMNNVMTLPGGSVYVPLNETNNVGRVFNTRLTYRKGSALVHMIRFEMNNDPIFFQTLQNFQLQFAGGSATGLDFKVVCENTSGLDFTDFFNQWYFGEGFPTFSVIWSQQEDTLYLNSIQTTSTTVTTLFKTPVEFKLTYAGGSQTIRVYQKSNDTTFKITIPYQITGITIDPNNWILNQVGTITHRKNLNLAAFIEGPFDEISGQMATGLNPDHLPLIQPYNQSPWNYIETEEIAELPSSNIVDWLLIELRDAPTASQALSGTRFARQSAFLLNNGSIVTTDGSSYLQFDDPITHQLYVVIHHRNHLSIMSATPLPYQKGIYNYDFSTGADQIYQGSLTCKELTTGVWGLIAGDADANGIIEPPDKVIAWETSAGMQGYLSSDLNLDGQSDNRDKDDLWLPNVGKGSFVPQ